MRSKSIIYIMLLLTGFSVGLNAVEKEEFEAVKKFNSRLTMRSNNKGSALYTYYYESFEGEVENWVALDLDGDGEYWGIYTEEAPYDTVAHSGEYGAGIRYNSAGNDDWLISPRIYLQDFMSLYFWARSHSSDYPEDFNVRISSKSGGYDNFMTIDSVRNVPAVWTPYYYDLSFWTGDSVYIAVQCVSYDDWYLWMDDFGIESQTSSVEEFNTQLQASVSLLDIGANYPEPFNAETTLRFEIFNEMLIDIIIYNSRGQKVMDIVDQKIYPAGMHEIRIEAGDMSTGIYFFTIYAGGGVQSEKLLLLK